MELFPDVVGINEFSVTGDDKGEELNTEEVEGDTEALWRWIWKSNPN